MSFIRNVFMKMNFNKIIFPLSRWCTSQQMAAVVKLICDNIFYWIALYNHLRDYITYLHRDVYFM